MSLPHSLSIAGRSTLTDAYRLLRRESRAIDQAVPRPGLQSLQGEFTEDIAPETKGRRLTLSQLKVGADAHDDLRRGLLIRKIIDNPENMPKDRKPIDPASIAGKNAGPTGCVLMVDANRMSPLVPISSTAGSY